MRALVCVCALGVCVCDPLRERLGARAVVGREREGRHTHKKGRRCGESEPSFFVCSPHSPPPLSPTSSPSPRPSHATHSHGHRPDLAPRGLRRRARHPGEEAGGSERDGVERGRADRLARPRRPVRATAAPNVAPWTRLRDSLSKGGAPWRGARVQGGQPPASSSAADWARPFLRSVLAPRPPKPCAGPCWTNTLLNRASRAGERGCGEAQPRLTGRV